MTAPARAEEHTGGLSLSCIHGQSCIQNQSKQHLPDTTGDGKQLNHLTTAEAQRTCQGDQGNVNNAVITTITSKSEAVMLGKVQKQRNSNGSKGLRCSEKAEEPLLPPTCPIQTGRSSRKWRSALNLSSVPKGSECLVQTHRAKWSVPKSGNTECTTHRKKSNHLRKLGMFLFMALPCPML